MLRVGLTGGIATGKSRVVSGLAAAGLQTLDLDRVAHEVMAPGGPAYEPVVAAFGRHVLDAAGCIDRRALGRRVFGEPEARQRLDAIVHPLVRAEEAARTARLGGRPGALLVTEAALLVEAGMHLRYRRLVVVECRPEQQLERLLARGLQRPDAQARIAAQMPLEDKRRFGHAVVDSSGTLEQTDRAAAALATSLQALATEAPPRTLNQKHAASVLAAALPADSGQADALRLAEWLAEQGDWHLPGVRGLLGASSAEPWWQAGSVTAPLGLTRLAPLLAVWCALRHAADPLWLYGAGFSLGRAVGARPVSMADGLLAGRATLHALAPLGPARLDAWLAEQADWADAAPSAPIRWQVERALRGGPPESPLERMLVPGSAVPPAESRGFDLLRRLQAAAG